MIYVKTSPSLRAETEETLPLTPSGWPGNAYAAEPAAPDLHFHDLRHEAISRFFEMGLTTPEVASISGHRDIRMLMRYAHPMRQRIIEQMDKGEPKRGS